MIESRWVSWEELLPFREQLIDMELELMTKYHYPNKIIPRSYKPYKLMTIYTIDK